MDKARLYLRYINDHKTVVKAAVIVILIAAALFFSMKGEKEENSEQVLHQAQEEVELSDDTETTETFSDDQSVKIYVDISGQIKNPGVYCLEEGSRLFDLIEKAGGLTDQAWTDQINQAEVLQDGQKITVPAQGDEAASGFGLISGKTVSGLININTADSQTLQEIPGVGPAMAERIIAYRQENGRFTQKEDIKKVSGIGEKTYEKLKDKITV